MKKIFLLLLAATTLTSFTAKAGQKITGSEAEEMYMELLVDMQTNGDESGVSIYTASSQKNYLGFSLLKMTSLVKISSGLIFQCTKATTMGMADVTCKVSSLAD